MYKGEMQRYTGVYPAPPFGAWAMHQGTPPGHCRQCGQSSGSCGCGCRECRKESKELLVTPAQRGDVKPGIAGHAALLAMSNTLGASANDQAAATGQGQAFIGGGCCVSLTVEYTPSSPTVQATVGVLVTDSAGTVLAWIHTDQPGGGYKVKEGVITTNPGATLAVIVLNATARVRWCEIFSC